VAIGLKTSDVTLRNLMREHKGGLKCPYPKKGFYARMNLCTCLKCIVALNSSNKSCHFIGFKLAKKPSISCLRPSQKGSGFTPDLTSQSTLHASLKRVNVM